MQSRGADPEVVPPDWKIGVIQIVALLFFAFLLCALAVGSFSLIGSAITALSKAGDY